MEDRQFKGTHRDSVAPTQHRYLRFLCLSQSGEQIIGTDVSRLTVDVGVLNVVPRQDLHKPADVVGISMSGEDRVQVGHTHIGKSIHDERAASPAVDEKRAAIVRDNQCGITLPNI